MAKRLLIKWGGGGSQFSLPSWGQLSKEPGMLEGVASSTPSVANAHLENEADALARKKKSQASSGDSFFKVN